jgi:hypothetical protein
MSENLTDFIRRYTSIASVIDTLRRMQLALLDPQSWDDRNDSHFMSLYKEYKGANGLYALCATEAPETYHHWRVFGGTSEGACLELKRSPLEDSFAGDGRIRFGRVQYKKIVELRAMHASDRIELPFLKRKPYEPECEYRIIAETAEPQAAALSIELPPACISRVFLNPWLPKPLAQSIKATIQEIPGCKTLPIIQTTMLENSRWKSAGDRLAGKKPTVPRMILTKPPKR